jgi:hypothetical protein
VARRVSPGIRSCPCSFLRALGAGRVAPRVRLTRGLVTQPRGRESPRALAQPTDVKAARTLAARRPCSCARPSRAPESSRLRLVATRAGDVDGGRRAGDAIRITPRRLPSRAHAALNGPHRAGLALTGPCAEVSAADPPRPRPAPVRRAAARYDRRRSWTRMIGGDLTDAPRTPRGWTAHPRRAAITRPSVNARRVLSH